MNLLKNILIISSLVVSQTASAQAWTQQGSDIDGEAADDRSGSSVSLSSDGSTVAIGAVYNDGNGTEAGHVRIYKNINGTWTQQGSDIDGEAAGDRSGSSVSLSSDGSTVAIGAINNGGNVNKAGHVRIYKNINGTWTQQGADIDGERVGDQSGWSVSLSSDGSTVAIGAINNDGNGTNATNAGHVRIYKSINGTWTQQGSDIDGEAANDGSGVSVSLSSDGSIVAIGAPGNDGSASFGGHVRIYKNINGTWTQQGADIDGERAGDNSGTSVSLSSDGSTVAIGASDGVQIYKNISGTWTQQGSDIDGEAANDASGYSVSLSSDGSTVAIGAPGNAGNGFLSGHVRIYKNINGTWTQQGSDIDGEAANDYSGWSVSLSSDGSTVAIGAINNDGNLGNVTNAGHVRIYKICTITSTTDIITSCGAYTWTNGVTYTSSNNTAKDTFVNAAGCDSIVTLNLTINYSSSFTDNITACNSYTWTNGVTYTANNNTATDTFINAAGCDSVVTLNLTLIDRDKLISTQPEDQSVDVNRSTNFIVVSGYDSVATYQWQLDDGAGFKDLSNVGQYSGVLTDTLLVSNVTLLNDGEIFRCLVTVNDCSDTSETVLLTIGKADVSERALTKDYAVYPNPTKGIVFISTKASLLGTSYTVYSSSGALICNGSITSEITTLDIQDLQEGIYFIQLGDNIHQPFKIIKK